MKFFKLFWHFLEKTLIFIGNTISGVVLFVFYYTIFALFAIPFRIFSKPLKSKSAASNFVIKEKTPSVLKDFESE